METLYSFFRVETQTEFIWVMIGFGGQLMFMLRFLIQWIATERAEASVIPVSFWWLSIAGAAILLAYAIYRLDPVFILGQSLGFTVYIRNLMFIYRNRAKARKEAMDSPPPD